MCMPTRTIFTFSPNRHQNNPRSPYFSDGPEHSYGPETYSTNGGSHRFGYREGSYDEDKANYNDNAYHQGQRYRGYKGYHGGTDRDRFTEGDGNRNRAINSQRDAADQRVRETPPHHQPEERVGDYQDTRSALRRRGGGTKANVHRGSGSSGSDGIMEGSHAKHDGGGAFEAGTGRGEMRGQEGYTGDRHGHTQVSTIAKFSTIPTMSAVRCPYFARLQAPALRAIGVMKGAL